MIPLPSGAKVWLATGHTDETSPRPPPRREPDRQSVIIIRERNGHSVPAVFGSESAALGFIKARIAKAPSWALARTWCSWR